MEILTKVIYFLVSVCHIEVAPAWNLPEMSIDFEIRGRNGEALYFATDLKNPGIQFFLSESFSQYNIFNPDNFQLFADFEIDIKTSCQPSADDTVNALSLSEITLD